jgi:hypothetical protein
VKRSLRGALARPSGGGRAPPRLMPPNGKSVGGFWPDSWLGPRAHISKASFGQSPKLHLSGRAARDCELVILANGEIVKRATLGQNEEVSIEFPAPRDTPLLLEFSSSITDSAGRELSFLVSSTNLFAEHDL